MKFQVSVLTVLVRRELLKFGKTVRTIDGVSIPHSRGEFLMILDEFSSVLGKTKKAIFKSGFWDQSVRASCEGRLRGRGVLQTR
jgi:hypothetical protein